jgi:predicted membrane-bound dolichyl-phosphate-mannose-protein mannosyltransferase
MPSVIVGALGYVVAYALGRNLFGSPLAGLASAAFLALDPMYYVHARLGVLEIFPAVLGAAAFAAVMNPAGPRHATAGLLLGLAIATKYTALFMGPPLIILAFLRSHGTRRDRLFAASVHYILIPGAVLMAAYIPYFVIWIRDYGVLFTITFFPWLQQEILGYGYAADLTHGYASHPLAWLLVTTPIGYYWTIPPGRRTQGWIYSMGNVATWWPSLIAMLWATGPTVRRLRARLPPRPGFQALMFVFLLSFLPYLFVQRITLIFYMSQYTPLLAVGAAGVFVWLWHRPGYGMFLAYLFVTAVAAVWVIYYPVVTATQITPEQVEWIFTVNPWMERVAIPGVYEP